MKARWTVMAILAALLLAGCSGSEQKTPEAGGPSGSATAKWEVIDTRTDLTDRARAKQNVEDTLTKFPDIGCLVGLWSYNGPAILSAVKGQGKAGQVQIVCFDEEADTLQGVADGDIHGTIVQQPFEFGYQSVKMLSALAGGDKSGVPEGGVLDIPVMVIKKDGVESFKSELAARLESGASSPAAKPGAPTIAFVTNNVSDFWKIARAGVNKGIGEFGVNVEFRMPPGGTPADQQAIVEDLISRKISGMAISPVDAKNQIDLINKACEAMSVVTQDSDAADSKRLCYIGTNNYKAGREAGKLIKEALPNGGKIMMFVGTLDAQNAKDRRQGILDELNGVEEK